MVEAQILNRDSCFVRVGRPVTVKLGAFPLTRYGTLEGRLAWISRDVVQDERLGPAYLARVSLHGPIDDRARTVQPRTASHGGSQNRRPTGDRLSVRSNGSSLGRGGERTVTGLVNIAHREGRGRKNWRFLVSTGCSTTGTVCWFRAWNRLCANRIPQAFRRKAVRPMRRCGNSLRVQAEACVAEHRIGANCWSISTGRGHLPVTCKRLSHDDVDIFAAGRAQRSTTSDANQHRAERRGIAGASV